jgi:hypothetical protein
VAQAREKGIELVGPDGLLTSLTKWVVWAFPCGNMGSRTREYYIVNPMVADGPGGDR